MAENRSLILPKDNLGITFLPALAFSQVSMAAFNASLERSRPPAQGNQALRRLKHQSIMSDIFKQQHPARTMAAIVCMLLFLACLGLFAWVSNLGAAVTGPVHITANATRILVTHNEQLQVIESDGSLQEVLTQESLGIDPYPIDLRWQDDSTLLVATQRPAGLHSCNYPAWHCRAIENPLFENLNRQIKVLPDPSDKGFFISDTAGGRLYWLSADGRSSHELSADKGFNMVNDIALDDEQRLWVADSGNRRIVILQADANGEWGITGEVSAKSAPARPDVDWPIMIALSPDGNAWVVQPDATGHRADLLLYDAQLGVKARIDLPDDADPTDVVRSGKSMLVTDRDNFRIMSVDIRSRAVSDFGSLRLQAILDAAARERADADSTTDLALAGMVVFGVLMVALAFWATPKGQRFTQGTKVPTLEARAGVKPRSSSLHWLVRDPKTGKFLRSLGRMLLVTTAAMLCLLVYTGYFVNGLLDGETARQAVSCVAGVTEMLVILGILILGAPMLGYLGLRQMRNRLGSDGHNLHVQLYDGQRLVLDPARLVYTKRILAYGKHLFPIQTGNRKPLYAEGELETHILPLLSRATRLGPFAMMRYLFHHQEAMRMASITYVIAAVATLWYTGMWRLILSANG